MNTISRKSLISLVSVSMLMLSATITQAATLNVPSQYSTIQAAINAASVGDTIIVAAGTYHEALTWNSKNLIILGAGQNVSIIDPRTANGGHGGTCLSTQHLTSASQIDGFTFRGGSAVSGAGMSNNASSPWVTRCTFSSNSASFYGGGMYNYGASSPKVTNCTFAQNGAAIGGGGMMNIVGSNPTVTNCVFARNFVGLHGVGGGGMYNSAGGGVIGSTTASSYPTLNNCTFYANSAPAGGGLCSNSDCKATVTNCIFWSNSVGIKGPVTLRYSDDQDLTNTNPDANGNFGADPLFISGGNLHLQPTSPCHNTGTNSVVIAPPYLSVGGIIIDLDGNPRVVAIRVDIGAYEIQQ